MSEPSTPTPASRREALIEALDKPLMALAVLTMILYLFDLRGMTHWTPAAYPIVTLLIDSVFIFDLILKLTTYGSQYVRTPWFLIDFLSCLPALDVIANSVVSLRAFRIIRGFRILRILRGLRILRALRAIPVFERLMNEPAGETGRKFHSAINAAMISLTIILLGIIVVVREGLKREHIQEIDAVAGHEVNAQQMKRLHATLEPPADTNYIETRRVLIDGMPRTAYFDMRIVDDRSNEYEFWLILGMMLMMLFFLYIMAYHQLDVSQSQLRALLNLALPKQVAETFLHDPTAYEQKSRTPAAVMFMDFVGFTQTCERLARDPDTISAHLERAMDRLVGELVEHDLIIDKFIGDAIMSFRGGPLVAGDLPEHAYRAVRAALDSIEALKTLDDPYFKRVKIGGAAADDCLIGAFGTSVRLSYTILGDGVNLAARLEPASYQCGTQNLFCETTYRLCATRGDLTWRRWGRIRVAGKSEPIAVFEAFDTADVGDPRFIATYHRALEAFEHNDFQPARDLFLLADQQRAHGDKPARYFAEWCDQLLVEGLPVGWEPVLDTHK
jgi:class 3 adenylate cyclase